MIEYNKKWGFLLNRAPIIFGPAKMVDSFCGFPRKQWTGGD